MALVLADRVQETTTSPGTGDVTLSGAVTGFRTFASVMANADTCYYTIADQGGANWEVGIGTYASGGNILQRTTVLSSSAGGTTKANFASGVQTVFITYPAEKSVNLDGTGNVSALGTVSSGTWQGTTIAVAYGGTGTTTSTGTGSVVLNTSPSLTTPNLGTPSAVTLTNATGLPLTTGVTGTLPTANGGTNLTSFTANGAVYATSTSALTTGTLPVVSGGTGTTTSTGSGSVVLNTSPSLTTPNIGAATGTSLVASNGLVSTDGFGGTLTTGISVDYDIPANNGRISVSGSSNLTFYGGGLGTTALLRLYSNGSIGVGSTPNAGSSGQVLTSNGPGAAPSWAASAATPIGSLQYFAGETVPGYPDSSWLKCDGSVYSQSTYSTLFSRIGLINNLLNPITVATTSSFRIQPKNIFATGGGGPGQQISGVLYVNGQYYVGSGAYYYSSTDAQTWTTRTTAAGSAAQLSAQKNWVYGEGVFAVVGSPSSAASSAVSSNTAVWTTGASNPNGNGFLCIAYGAGQTYKYIAGSDTTASLNTLWGNTSSDLSAAWTALGSGTNSSITHVSFGNGVYLAFDSANKISRSTNGGTSWTYLSAPLNAATGRAGTFGDNLYIIGGNSGVLSTSTNGINWTARTSGTAQDILGLAFAPGQTNKYVYAANTGDVGTSTDGITWSVQTLPTAATHYAAAFGGGIYVLAAGGGYMVSSTDAVTWTSTVVSNQSQIGVTYAAGQTNAFVAVMSNGGSLTSTDGVTWTNPVNTVSTLNATTFGNGIYIYGGIGGALGTSTDGITWTPRTFGSAASINSLVYGAGITDSYVAVGTSGTIRTSTDGITWNARTSGTTTTILSSTFGNGIYVVAGNSGYIRTSTDGITWTARTFGSSSSIFSLAYASGQTEAYVAGTVNGQFRTSTDGITWTARTSPIGGSIVRGIAYGNNVYVAVGAAGYNVTSTDGITWTNPINLGGSNAGASSIAKLAVAPGQTNRYVYITTGSRFATSTDGATWTTQSLPTGPSTVLYGGGLYIVGDSGGGIYTSTDAVTWGSNVSPSSAPINNFAYINGSTTKYVAVANTALFTSTDAVTWSVVGTVENARAATSGNNIVCAVTESGKVTWASVDSSDVLSDLAANYRQIASETLITAAFGNNTFVVAGTNGVLFTSGNGIDGWTSRDSGTLRQINSVIFNPTTNTFIYCDQLGNIGTSTDGITWTVTYVNNNYQAILSVVADGSFYLAGGGAATLGRSTNLTTWSWFGLQTSLEVASIIFDSVNNRFVAAGSAYLATSTDGKTWSVKSPNNAQNVNHRAISFNSSRFVTVGIAGTVYTSTDGNSWFSVSTGASVSMNKIAYGNNVYVAVGNAGALRTSTDGLLWSSRIISNLPTLTGNFSSVAYNTTANLFFASFGTSYATSTDGVTWTAPVNGTRELTYYGFSGTFNDVVFGSNSSGNAIMVDAVGNAATSTDGGSFTYYGIPSSTSGAYLGYLNNLHVLSSTAAIYTSTDGLAWRYRGAPLIPNSSIATVNFGDNRYVIPLSVADYVGSNAAAFNDFVTTTDFNTWNLVKSYSPSIVRALSYAGGSNAAWLYVGDNGTFGTSTNGAVWDYAATSTTLSTQTLTYQNGQFLLALANGSILTSSDALYWKITNPGSFDNGTTPNNTPTYSLTYGTVYVAGGLNGRVYTSTNAVTWVGSPVLSRDVPNSITALAYGNNTYVYATNVGAIASSTDAITWTARTSGTSSSLNALVYAAGLFVAVGNTGAIVTSTNGITWTTRTSPAATSYTALAYYNGKFVASGGAVTATSTDGITWLASQSAPLALSANSIATYNSNLLATATNTVYYSYDGYGWNSFMASASGKGIAGGGGYVVVGGTAMVSQNSGLTVKQVLNYNTATQFVVPNSSLVLASATSTTQLSYNLPISSQSNLFIKAL